MGFFLDRDVLYKKSKDQMLLRCVDADEAKKIVREIHEGVCGTHANGHVMARQIMRAEYYWMTLENDCISYVRKCHKCQIYADVDTVFCPGLKSKFPSLESCFGSRIQCPFNPNLSKCPYPSNPNSESGVLFYFVHFSPIFEFGVARD